MTAPRVLVVQLWEGEETSFVLGVFADEEQARKAIEEHHADTMRHLIEIRAWPSGKVPLTKIEEKPEEDGFYQSRSPGNEYLAIWCEVGVPIHPKHGDY